MSNPLKLKAEWDALMASLKAEFLEARSVAAYSWQSTKAPQGMPEIFNRSFTLDLRGVYETRDYREIFKPNLPWADEHFVRERVSGHPLNPGATWRIWPYSASANKHRIEGEEDPQFSHSYAERYWPKLAGRTTGGEILSNHLEVLEPNEGIRFEYGDLGDLVQILLDDPLTRQAYLPVWFPEDLAAARAKERVPCTLGYHFILRDDKFHCIYPMRSCDFVRHFRDDVYLTVRLQAYILQMLKFKDPTWNDVKMGTFTMHITSLHMFDQDQTNLFHSMKGEAK